MISEKPALPTTTAHTARLGLFQATRRPKELKRAIVETPWGKIRISGRLGQQHADVFEAICYEREKRGELEDGRIKLLVDPARVRRRANIRSGQQLEEIIDELRSATISIDEPSKFSCIGGLVDHVDKAMRADGTYITRANPLGGERHLWRVELGKAFCKLVAGDIWLGYDPAPLAALNCGIAQAVARHIISHKAAPSGGWMLDTLIQAVAPGLTASQMRDKRRELRANTEQLEKIGIIINGDRVHKKS